MLQALISRRTKAFEVSQIDAYCKKRATPLPPHSVSWGVQTIGSQREEE